MRTGEQSTGDEDCGEGATGAAGHTAASNEGAATADGGTRTAGREATTTRPAVLIPSGKKMKSYACMRSLNRHGVHTVVASEYDRIPHFSSRHCGERVRLPASPADLVAYKEALLDVAARPDVETIVPVRECDVYVFARYRDEFEAVVSLATPTLSTLEKAHDRLRLADEAAAAGVPMAETRLLSEVDEWDRNLVVKPRYNVLTDAYLDDVPRATAREVKNVRFVTPGDDPDDTEIRAEMGHEPIVQDFIPQDDKILYCALWQDGEPLSTYQHRQIRQNSWVGGGGVYRVSTYSEAVEEAAADLLGRLDWTGFACIEYLRDAETGEWKFLEINPRVWQSMPEAVRAGVDFPLHYWRAARRNDAAFASAVDGEDTATVDGEVTAAVDGGGTAAVDGGVTAAVDGGVDEFDDDYDEGVACHIAYGEAAHLRSVLHDDSPFLERPSFAGTFWNIAVSCVRHPRFDYVRLDDPRFFLSSLRELSSTGVTASREYNTGNMHIRGSPGSAGDTQ